MMPESGRVKIRIANNRINRGFFYSFERHIARVDAKKRFDGDDEKFELFEEFFCGFIGVDSMKTLLLGEYSKLVWSENFEDELRHIQKRRKKLREEENVKRVTSELIESTK